jgi:hypothetical protein
LWLKKYNKDVLSQPDASSEAIFEKGNEVGELACKLFPNGKKIPYEGTTFDEKIALTKQWLDEGIENIYEASFSFDGIFIMVDILHVNDDGSVDIYEVKSSTDVKEVYLHDASIQYYVLNGLGFNVKSTNIVHINNKYVRGDKLEIDKLFSVINISDEVLELQVNIPSYLKEFEKVLLERDNIPEIDIGQHCHSPYACDAINHCWSHIPDYSVFDISRLRSDKKFALYRQGIVNFEDIENISSFSTGPFRILCQSGKITNTQGHRYEDRNRRRAICSRY